MSSPLLPSTSLPGNTRLAPVMGAVLGPIIGPILGGWLTDNLDWRWVFFINIPIAAVGFLILGATLPRRAKRDRPKFDGFGFVSHGSDPDDIFSLANSIAW